MSKFLTDAKKKKPLDREFQTSIDKLFKSKAKSVRGVVFQPKSDIHDLDKYIQDKFVDKDLLNYSSGNTQNTILLYLIKSLANKTFNEIKTEFYLSWKLF